MSPLLNVAKPAVMAAALAYVSAQGLVSSHQVVWGVAKELGWAETPEAPYPGEFFEGQVTRALRALTAAGAVVKVGRGREHPSGVTETRASWYSPGRFAAECERAAQALAQTQAATARWSSVAAWARGHGLTVTSAPGEPVTLSLDSWEALGDWGPRPVAS